MVMTCQACRLIVLATWCSVHTVMTMTLLSTLTASVIILHIGVHSIEQEMRKALMMQCTMAMQAVAQHTAC